MLLLQLVFLFLRLDGEVGIVSREWRTHDMMSLVLYRRSSTALVAMH